MASPGSRTRTLIIYKELESKVKNKVKEKDKVNKREREKIKEVYKKKLSKGLFLTGHLLLQTEKKNF